MIASVVDLRYRMREVLRALTMNEEVKITYHGKEVGVIQPVRPKILKKVTDHPFFGMARHDRETVERKMERLRGGRYRAL
ncbi:MAG: type II toxin-antitoxin system Phd/YefM family antitoxin [Candidatus Omnitrophica bacterium]|nr:type II toxin-antitoxin system Phd/YefM family antitoxin [Candidatus Omnitrophota bacterium]